MADDALKGVARVDALLLEPLAGLKRPRGLAAADHDKAIARLRGFLVYMSDLNLAGLRDVIARHAAKGNWPGEGLVRAWAFALQVPPPKECDYATSLMRSEMGLRAQAEGWAVELFQIAKRIGPPPNRYIIRELKADAETNVRKVARIAAWVADGTADPASRDWLRTYEADQAEIAEILAAKDESETE